jgi:hypothetical protein
MMTYVLARLPTSSNDFSTLPIIVMSVLNASSASCSCKFFVCRRLSHRAHVALSGEFFYLREHQTSNYVSGNAASIPFRGYL